MNFPFSAIVGQDKLKKALLLCAINPAIGGVLIRGDKGTAKSTAARALSEIAPLVALTESCQFNCSENSNLTFCEACKQPGKQVKLRQVPFVNLPLGASEERVLGQLDLEGVLVEKRKKLQPGLLASANQGILYIDEVNLLSDHLVDVLLDVAAMGINTIEREGLSVSHPARFTLIGTMNVEEGLLRPQFLDRFGLMIDIEAPNDIKERTEVVRRRMEFETQPAAFRSKWEKFQHELQEKLVAAQNLLPMVTLHDDLLILISELCSGMGVKSLRGDIVMYKTAITIAALEGRTKVLVEDIREAATLVLNHRTQQRPVSEPAFDQEKLNDLINNSSSTNTEKTQKKESSSKSPELEENDQQGDSTNPNAQDEQLFEPIKPKTIPKLEEVVDRAFLEESIGRRNKNEHVQIGQYSRAETSSQPKEIAIGASILNAMQRNSDHFELRKEDIHQKVRSGKTGNLIIFVVDASGSMASGKRMEAVKGTVLSLLNDAYQKRDEVSVISFRGIEAKVLLQPTRNIEMAERALDKLLTGGRTPLAHALQTTLYLLTEVASKSELKPLLVILSDGKANVTLTGEDPWEESLKLAVQINSKKISGLVINTDLDYLQLGKSATLAEALGFRYVSLTDINAEQLTPVIKDIL